MEVVYRGCCGIDVHKKVIVGLACLQKNGELRQFNKKWFGVSSNYLGPVKK